jgi:hypothetical protein
MLLTPIPQSLAYHLMADTRTLFGIPNALNVLSNLPFAVVGLAGLAAVFSRRHSISMFVDRWERWPWAVFFIGVASTSVGSSYYHLAPDNARLVWDRLPMAVAFMGLLAAIVAEHVSVPAGRRLMWPLVALGVASVAYWRWTELQQRGDLRPYLLVQFGSLAAIALLITLRRSRYSQRAWLFAGLAAYAVAKLFEAWDDRLFTASLGVVSGHTLKHLVAAASAAGLVYMLRTRTVVRAIDNTKEVAA